MTKHSTGESLNDRNLLCKVS